MPTYYITQTRLDQLKVELAEHPHMGVGMLSRILGIQIASSWRTEDVVVSSMYFPEENCTFFFPRRYIKIN